MTEPVFEEWAIWRHAAPGIPPGWEIGLYSSPEEAEAACAEFQRRNPTLRFEVHLYSQRTLSAVQREAAGLIGDMP